MKQVGLKLPEETFEFFQKIFPGGSAYGDLSQLVCEMLNTFKPTLRELKRFTKDEVTVLLDITNSWLIDLSQFDPKLMLLGELDDYYSLEKYTELPSDFRVKIEGLAGFQVVVLLRWLKGLWARGEADKAYHFFQEKKPL